jgi:hypothetical protein
MFVLCVLYSIGQKAKPGQSGQRSTDKVQREKKSPVVSLGISSEATDGSHVP